MEEKKVQNYTKSYGSIGMCLGISLGLVYGLIFTPENIALGLCLLMPVGNLLGTIIGTEKDMKLAKEAEDMEEA